MTELIIFAPRRSACLRSALLRSVFLRSAAVRTASVRRAFLRIAPLRLAVINLAPLVYPLAAPHTPDACKEIACNQLNRQLAFLDGILATQDFLTASYSIADIYFFWVITLLPKLGYDVSKFAALEAYRDRLSERSAVQRALRDEAALAPTN